MKTWTMFFLLCIGSAPVYALQPRTVTVVKYDGSRQCGNPGLTPRGMQMQLTGAGVSVTRSGCANDRLAYPAVCGAETGRLNLFDIPAAGLDSAIGLGFFPISELPDASEVSCSQAQASGFQGQAVEIAIGGIGPPVDAGALRKVRRALARAVEDNVLSLYVVYGYGVEGGFSGCVEEGEFAPPLGFRTLIKRLQSIQANPSTTAISLTLVQQCRTDLPG